MPPITDPSQPLVLRVVPHQRGLSVRLLSFTIWVTTLTLTARLGPAGPIPVGLSIGGVALIEERERGAILTEFAVTLVRALFNEYADALRFHGSTLGGTASCEDDARCRERRLGCPIGSVSASAER